ncbi:protein phosphatase 1M [Zonotrichia albicollis]|uniref:protein phosphatase 1M n=1 Tax=Zonotrichia albicollis TaxID=44394 RepID=UPI003D811169
MSGEWLRRWRRGGPAERPGGAPTPGPGPPPPALRYRRPKFVPGGGEEAPRGGRAVRGAAPERPLPWGAGYAEVINAEKSEFNEDQAACCQISVRRREPGLEEDEEWLILCSTQFLTGHYWALFDGHGGPDAAIIASNYLHYCIKQKLEEVVGGITEAQPPMHLSGRCVCDSDPQFVEEKHIHATDLVVGALENAFQECGKLYVANAGDSRAILVLKDSIVPMSSEFTPESERQRIQHLAFLFPKLLDGEFTRFEFPRRLKGDDVGHKVLYRDYFMEGWGYKTVEKADLKYPLVHGHGKQARLLGTLAVSRGLGDHQLKVIDTNIEVKPFLSCIPKELSQIYCSAFQVNVFDFAVHDIKEDDVLIMATDGLWDVLCNDEVAHVVRSFLAENRTDPQRFSELAKCLVCRARGKKRGHQWMLDDSHEASYDDISVFVIPLHNREED